MRSKAFLLAVGAFAAGALVGALIEHKTEVIRYLRGLRGPQDLPEANVRSGTEGADWSGSKGGTAYIQSTSDRHRVMLMEFPPASETGVSAVGGLAGQACFGTMLPMVGKEEGCRRVGRRGSLWATSLLWEREGRHE